MKEKIIRAGKKSVLFFYEWLVLLIGAIYFLFLGLLLSFLGLSLKPFLSEKQGHWVGRNGMHYLSRLFFAGLDLSGIVKMDFSELERLRDEHGLILVANHPCLMDALFVASRLTNVVCVMKPSVLYNPVFFGGAALGGFIKSDSPVHFVQQCQETLKNGGQLLLFPEGTRTVTDTVNPFKGGFSLIAKKTSIPIQTIFIETNTPFLSKHWPVWKKPQFPLIYRTTPGERFNVVKEDDHRLFTKKIEKYFKDRLAD